MKRTFAYLALFAVNMIVLVSICLISFVNDDVENSNQQITQVTAKAVALGLRSKIKYLNKTLDQISQDPALLTALENNNEQRLQQTLDHYQSLLPGVLKLRFLQPETNLLDETHVPHLGYADMDLVRETFKKNQYPLIQGIKGENRHLAIARQSKLASNTTAVLLASMNYDFLKSVVLSAQLKQGLIQLKQNTLVLAQAGNKALQSAENSQTIPVLGTKWVVQYWSPESSISNDLTTLIGIIAVISLLLLLGFFYAFRYTTTILEKDQNSILMAVKDLMEGNMSHGTYPAILDETKMIISSLRTYKRTFEQQSTKNIEEEAPAVNEQNLDDLFNEEPENPDLEIGDSETHDRAEFDIIDPATNQPITITESSKPIVIPDSSDLDNSSVGVPEKNLGSCFPDINIFRAYDIRGIVGESLNQEVVHDIGRALGSEMASLGLKTMVVARDGRNSSPQLSEALISGIISSGTDVINLGMVPTPVLYFVVHHQQDHSGVMLTGSHNPANYNGLKMVLNQQTLFGDQIQQIRQRIESNDFISADAGKENENNLFQNEYIGAICDETQLARPMKIVVDCGNGVTGELAPTILKTLGCEVIELFCDIDGDFPNHHPDPSDPDNLKDLAAAIKYYQADLGIAFDGDGDRLGVLDSNAKIIWPDRQMMVFAKDLLNKHPGAEIIYDVKCSHLLEQQISKFGGVPVMYKTGHSFMKAKIKQSNAKLAGEMSGHLYFNDGWFGFDDALYAACKLIAILSADTRTSNEVFADFPDSVNTPELNVSINENEKAGFIDQLIEKADFNDGKINTIDGLRVDFSDGWGLVRASNTTPVLVMRFDADNKAALKRIQEQFKTLLLSIKPDLELPF